MAQHMDKVNPAGMNTMNGPTSKVILITGASSGIGQVCASHLADNGYTVYGTTRDENWPDDKNSGLSYKTIFMDVNNTESVVMAVNEIQAAEGHLDGVINNAGFGISGPLELTTIEEAQAQFETNYFGIMRVCSAVLPVMRAQGSGYIINITSLGGLIGLPYQGVYSATKFAAEGFSEALYGELRSKGIKVVIIEPGDFATAFTRNRRVIAGAENDIIYNSEFKRTLSVIESDELNGDNPVKIARLAEKILRSPDPKLRYRVGSLSQKFSIVLKKIIPDKLFARIIMDHYRVGKSES